MNIDIENKNKNQKISEFDRIKLKNVPISNLIIPVSLYNSDRHSYVNIGMKIDDIMKYSYSYSINYMHILDNYWEEFQEDAPSSPIIYDLNVEDPFDNTLQP